MFTGGGGEGNTNVMGNFLPECIQVAPDGYDRHWYNIKCTVFTQKVFIKNYHFNIWFYYKHCWKVLKSQLSKPIVIIKQDRPSLGKDSFEKKKVVNFHNFGPDPPPPLKVVKTPIFFFLTPWPKKHFVQIKKNSPLKTQNT